MTPLRQRICAALLGACFALCATAAQAVEAPDASLSSPAWLAPKTTAKKPTKAVAAGPTVGLGRSLGVLLLVSVLGGTALYLRSRKNKAPKARLAQLRVVGSTKLGGRAQLVLAEVNGRQLLLGVTDRSVRKLGWMDAELAEDEELVPSARPRLVAAEQVVRSPRVAVEPVAAPAAAKRSFRDLLTSAVGNLGNRPDEDSAALTLAAETQDTFTRSTPRAAEPRRTEVLRKNGNPQMIDLEGQAKGLLARLGEPRG
ncbi:MAG TPA: flagellar biosynthetic protein FliO [Polyangiaceae bacterium]